MSLLLTALGTKAHPVLLDNDLGADLVSMQAATAGWGRAEMGGDDQGDGLILIRIL